MLYEILLILGGFVILIKGADLLIDGSCAIAQRYRVPDIVVGLTIVALGTSAPELVVSIFSALKGNGGIAIGNVMGSNIANICLVLGVSGLIAPIAVKKTTVRREIPFCMATTGVLFIILALFNGAFLVTRVEGIILLLCLCIYMYFMLTHKKEDEDEQEEHHSYKLSTSTIYVILGCAGLVFGGDITVKNCVSIATRLHVSEEMIGLTIVALGTSLPELATSVISVLKGKTDIAIGNVVGSNIMNTCLVLGCAATINPISSNTSFTLDAILVTAATALLLLFMYTGKKRKLDRFEAGIFLLAYAIYIGFVVHRGMQVA